MKVEISWEFNCNEQALGLKLGSFHEKNKRFLLVHTRSGIILLFSLKGTILLKKEIAKRSPIWYALIEDIDNDGKKEIVLGGMDGTLQVFKIFNKYRLKPYWIHKFGNSIGGILIDDINNNKKVEIISYSLDKSIRVLDSLTGSLIWGQIFEDGIGEAIIWKDSIDVTKKEIIACGNDGTVRSFDPFNGNLLWYMHFDEKMRCIDYINSNKVSILFCGGDDKKLHLINKANKKEIKTLKFNNYIWKCISFSENSKVLISSYSFAHFNQESAKDVKFTSKLVCMDQELDIIWQLEEINIETIKFLNFYQKKYILLGTTKGELLLVDPIKGRIITSIQKESTINGIEFDATHNLIITCHDNGSIYAYSLRD